MESSSPDGLDRLISGRYRLIEPIGRGGMATVYRGQDEVLGRHVAVKLFRASAVDPDDVGRQETEMRLLASLSHPGLVTLFDAGKDDAGRDDGAAGEPRAFLVMELVEGPDLRKRLREGDAMPVADAAHVGAELAGALAYIHARGVIHRDVKPANILLPGSVHGMPPRAQLTDFGIARVLDGARLTATGATLGTANYLSPEQASGSSATTASDIYSLGLVLLECLTGHVEFSGSAVESAVARLGRDPDVPQHLPDGWRELLSSMTARNPAARPAAAAVASELLGFRWGGATGQDRPAAEQDAADRNPVADRNESLEILHKPLSLDPTGPARQGQDALPSGGAPRAQSELVPLPTMTTADGVRQGVSHASAPPPTPPSIGKVAASAAPLRVSAGAHSRTQARPHARSRRFSGFLASPLPVNTLLQTGVLPAAAGRRTTRRALLALLAVTVLTMAVVLASGRVDHAGQGSHLPDGPGEVGRLLDHAVPLP